MQVSNGFANAFRGTTYQVFGGFFRAGISPADKAELEKLWQANSHLRTEMEKICKAAKDKQVKLRQILENNPYKTYYRWACVKIRPFSVLEKHPCLGMVMLVLGGIFLFMGLMFVYLFFGMMDICTGQGSKRYDDEECAWVLQQINAHPDLDSEAIDAFVEREIQALVPRVASSTKLHVQYWNGTEHVDGGSGADYDLQEFAIQFYDKPPIADQEGGSSSMVPTKHGDIKMV